MNSTKLFILIGILLSLTVSVSAVDRALVIGIEHYQNESKCNQAKDNLDKGCITPTFGGKADAESITSLLQTKFRFAANSIHTLTESQATVANIRWNFKNWIIKDTEPGDRVFIMYSGHGSRIPDDGNDEEDGLDEILAPYDIQTVPQIGNYIRDDEINEWIASLSGRQVVMVFDSCHSGTISRTLSRKGEKFSKYLITENLAAARSVMTDTFSVVPKSRDLSTVVDKYMQNKTPNVVIISAAEAYQQAMWLDADGTTCGENSPTAHYRGALAYLFEKIYLKENPTLSELNNELRTQMAALGDQGTHQLCPAATGYQIPELEFNSAVADQTLWGGKIPTDSQANSSVSTHSPEVALQNPLSTLSVKLNINAPNNSYRIGEDINYSVEVSEDAFIYIIVFSRNDTATVIYPNPDNSNNFFQKGTISMPTAVAAEPLGKDVWIAIASKKRIAGLENLPADKVFKWKEIYEKINVKELQTGLETVASTRGVVPAGKLKISDWQSTSAVMTTLPQKP